MSEPLKGRFDNALFALFTRSWDAAKIESYPRTLETHVKTTDGIAADAFQMIDVKAAGMLTHVSMMIAGLGISASFLTQHAIEEAVIVGEICLYLLVAVGCLRCLSVLNPSDAGGTSAELKKRVHRELLIRQELYRFCNNFTIRFTILVFISLPVMLWWHPAKIVAP
jgi:hypothetical protein